MNKKNIADGITRGIIKLIGIYGTFTSLIFFLSIGELSLIPFDAKFGKIFFHLVGLILIGLTILVAAKPNDPLPWSWITLFLFGGILVVIGINLSEFRIPGVALILCGILLAIYSNSSNKEGKGT